MKLVFFPLFVCRYMQKILLQFYHCTTHKSRFSYFLANIPANIYICSSFRTGLAVVTPISCSKVT